MFEFLLTLSVMALAFCVATVFVALIAGVGLTLWKKLARFST